MPALIGGMSCSMPRDALCRTIGSHRFVFGTGWPLRLAENPAANLALLPDDLRDRGPSDGDVVAARAREAARR